MRASEGQDHATGLGCIRLPRFAILALGPRNSGLPDLRALHADLG